MKPEMIVTYRNDEEARLIEQMDSYGIEEARINRETESVAYTCLFWAVVIACIFIGGAFLFLRAIFN